LHVTPARAAVAGHSQAHLLVVVFHFWLPGQGVGGVDGQAQAHTLLAEFHFRLPLQEPVVGQLHEQSEVRSTKRLSLQV
jgi:hypothetical protein